MAEDRDRAAARVVVARRPSSGSSSDARVPSGLAADRERRVRDPARDGELLEALDALRRERARARGGPVTTTIAGAAALGNVAADADERRERRLALRRESDSSLGFADVQRERRERRARGARPAESDAGERRAGAGRGR